MSWSEFQREYYEAAEFWEGNALGGEDNRRRYEETAALIPSDARSLVDVGCGNGRFGALVDAIRRDMRVVGVDRSEAALELVTTEKVPGDVVDLPFDDGAFECVTCLEVIEHLPVDAYDQALRELARVAAKYVIVGVPYREQIERNVTQCPRCRTVFNVDLHLRSFDDSAMDSLLSEHSFRLTARAFPGSATRLRLLHSSWNRLVAFRRRRTQEAFESPICPLCGFSESDRAAAQASVAREASGEASAPRPPRVLSSTARVLSSAWPSFEDPGYWVVGLYERT